MKLIKRIIGWIKSRLIKQTKKNPARAVQRISLKSMMRDLDWIMDVQSSYPSEKMGVYSTSLTKMMRRIGTYVDTGSMNSWPTTVSYVDELGLPALFSVGLREIDYVSDAPRLRLVSIGGIKVERADWGIEQTNDTVYQMVSVYASESKPKRWSNKSKRFSVSGYYFAAVDADGKVRLLKEKGKPPALARELSSHNKNGSVAEYVGDLENAAAQAINSFRARDMNWLIRVETKRKHLSRVTFGVRPLDVPFVFNSRVKVKTKNGKTRPIYHPVRAHSRITKRGESLVKLHHRGLREFQWRGFKCTISIPGKHAGIANDLVAPAQQGISKKKGYTAAQVANIINGKKPKRMQAA